MIMDTFNMKKMNEKLRRLASTAASAAITLTRPDYFDGRERGELHELKQELNSDSSFERREAVRKVIAAMTVGKDVSSLFTDMLRCMGSSDLTTKKMVHLYVVIHARGQKDLALLTVNSLVRDSEDKDPAIRALSLRTIGSLGLPLVADYLDEPLRRCVRDEHPMVRRAAVICIGKVFAVAPDATYDLQLDKTLLHLLDDPDGQVAANALAVLQECNLSLPIDTQLIAKLTVLLENAPEWSQVTILESFIPFASEATPEQALIIVQRAIPRLSHSNAAVLASALRILAVYGDRFPEVRDQLHIEQRMSMSIVSLFSPTSPPEIQWTVAHSIPGLLSLFSHFFPTLSSFFVNYNDPVYLKLAKLDVLVAMTERQAGNIMEVLRELIEYCKDDSPDVAEAAVRSIAQLYRMHGRAPQIRPIVINTMLDLAKVGIEHVQRAVIITLGELRPTDLFTNYDGYFLFSLAQSESAVMIDPEVRCAMIGLVPLVNPHYFDISAFLSHFDFSDEPVCVQHTLLSTAFQLRQYCASILEKVIEQGLKSGGSADIMDRCRMYKRLMSVDPGLLVNLTTSIVDVDRYVDRGQFNVDSMCMTSSLCQTR